MAQQTAIDWLWDISQEREIDAFDFLKAKAMVKEQVVKAWDLGRRYIDYPVDGEQYYNETYCK